MAFLDSLKRWLNPEMTDAAQPDPVLAASAALMAEIMRADGTYDPQEREALLNLLMAQSGCSAEVGQTLMAEAEAAVEEAHDLFQVTSLINARCDAEARVAGALAPRAAFVEHRAVEPFYFGVDAWTAALRRRRVLIVHPFADTIRDQYAKHARGDLLWPEAVLPRDLDLLIVKAPSSLGRDANGTWSAALRDTKAAVDGAFPVDAALLGCGAYGLPLAAHVVSRGASAVYVGGGLQLLFGIMGKRWADRAEIAAVARASWVWPSPAETPPHAEVVEGGAYWG